MTRSTAHQPGSEPPGTVSEPVDRTAAEPAGPTAQERLAVLEVQVQTLAQAVRSLAKGLEEIPTQEPAAAEQTAARGARLAHELLLSQGM